VLAALLALAVAAPAKAQEWTGEVIQPGQLRITLGGEYSAFRSLWNGGTEVPIGAGLGGPLDPATFSPLAAYPAAMESFLAVADTLAFPVTDADFQAGSLDGRLALNNRVGSGRLAVGIFPRVEIGVTGSIIRTEELPLRVELAGGTVGLNPDRTGNANLFARIDTVGGAALGASAVLPLEGSRLGSHLQDLVFEATGDSLLLPVAALTVADLGTSFGFAPYPHLVSPVTVGDVELDARTDLLRTFDGPYYPSPEDGELNARLTLRGRVRLPVGEVLPRTPRTNWAPISGHGGLGAGGAMDVFFSRFLQVSATADWLRLDAASVLMPVPVDAIRGATTGTTEASFEPGEIVRISVAPKIRLTEEISVGGVWWSERQGAGAWAIEGVRIPIEERTAESAGLTIGYSSLAASQRGRTGAPIEASISFATPLSGSGGSPAARVATARVTFLRRLWGGE
jgi:hypothetical protein